MAFPRSLDLQAGFYFFAFRLGFFLSHGSAFNSSLSLLLKPLLGEHLGFFSLPIGWHPTWFFL